MSAYWMCFLNWLETYSGAITAVATIFIGFFTFTLWLSTKRLWTATNSAVELARDEFNASHRPKIRVKHVWMKRGIFENQSIIFDLAIVNTGDTPAVVTALRHAIHILVGNHSLPARIFENDNQATIKRSDTMQPGITVVYSDLFYQRNLTHEEFTDMQCGRAYLYIVGDIEYEDGERRPRKQHSAVSLYSLKLEQTCRS